MVQFPIRLRSFHDIQALAALAAERPYRIQVGDGRIFVGAKSFLSIFCLNLRGNLQLVADCPEEELPLLRQRLGSIALQSTTAL